LSIPDIQIDEVPETWPILTGDDEIKIIYRNNIKVHFSTYQEAASFGYQDFDKNLDMSKGGIVFPFTGIRGESKDLW
jgi:hypothetical protein